MIEFLYQHTDILIALAVFCAFVAGLTAVMLIIMTVGVILFYIVRSFIWKGAFK